MIREAELRLLVGVRLLATDLDGTLLDHGSVASATQDALVTWRDQGGMMAIVTGRPLGDLERVLEATGCGHGWPFPDALICDERDIFCRVDGRWTLSAGTEDFLAREQQLFAAATELATELIAQGAGAGVPVKRFDAGRSWERRYVQLHYPNAHEAAVACDHATGLARLRRIRIVPVRNGRLVALRHPASRKGGSLALLAEHFGLRPAAVVAVGDSHNDLTMLDGSRGFTGAAVANADLAIREAVARSGGLLLPEERSLGVAWLLQALLDATPLGPQA